MASDITEEFQVDITNQSAASVPVQNNDITYDIAFNGQGFFDASNPQNPYRRQTAQYKKDQNDNSAEPGEQTLTGWWLRSQSSFHFGAGIDFYEPSQEQSYVQNQTIRFRYKNSEGVNVWEPGKVSLLKDVVASSHPVVSTTTKTLRSIPTGMLLHDGYDVDKLDTANAQTHYIEYTGSSTVTKVYAICDDGKYAYWLTDKGSPLKWELYRKPLSGSSASTADEYRLHQAAGNIGTTGTAAIEYVKDRLIFTINNEVYECAVDGSVNTATPTKIYTQSNPDFVFTDITESAADVYLSGYQGNRSVIYRVYYTPDATSGIPEPLTLVVVAELPRGEIVYSIKTYLGYMIIGTSLGVRIAQIQTDGSIVYGPLLFEAEQPVYQIATASHFAWVTAKIGGDTGLVRIDLSTQIDNLVFPYANDLQAVDVALTCTGVALIGSTDRVAFTSSGTSGNVYYESATVLRTSGFIQTGLIRFATLENKYFKYIKERADYSYGGTLSISTLDSTLITVGVTTGNQDVGISERDADDTKAFIFTINRNPSTTSQGPTFYGYQLKALPATRRQRLIQFNVFCFDTEIDRYRNMYGYKGRAFERLAVFEELEESSDIITVQDFRTNETFQGLIEETSFTGVTAPMKNFSGFGGILTVTVRKI
jgi:hypothetical protein